MRDTSYNATLTRYSHDAGDLFLGRQFHPAKKTQKNGGSVTGF